MKSSWQELPWQKNWEGRFSVLETTMNIGGYGSAMRQELDTEIGHVLIIHHQEHAACYLLDDEMRQLGKNLLKRAHENPSLVKKWTAMQRKYANELFALVQKPITKKALQEQLETMAHIAETFSAYQIAMKEFANHLGEDSARFLPPILEARKHSEKAYIVANEWLERFLEVLGEKKLRALTYQEMKSYLAEGKIPALATRQETFGLLRDTGFRFLKQTEVEAWETSLSGRSQVKGEVAYPGRVTGTARILLDYRNATIEKGEILVTGMTDPDAVPLMEKAGAIVTDAGGILCHAAIVARELKKPCVIGTKKATKVFKDGDMIEVDADNGIVKVIE